MKSKCQKCGGEVEIASSSIGNQIKDSMYKTMLKNPIKNKKKKRIQKKLNKKIFSENNRIRLCINFAATVINSPIFKCKDCGFEEGGYSYLGRNLVRVDELPQGAYAQYEKFGMSRNV
jgi:DNA-directed RNA polymerase subunit M/transcription elongation factor TFIIS